MRNVYIIGLHFAIALFSGCQLPNGTSNSASEGIDLSNLPGQPGESKYLVQLNNGGEQGALGVLKAQSDGSYSIELVKGPDREPIHVNEVVRVNSRYMFINMGYFNLNPYQHHFILDTSTQLLQKVDGLANRTIVAANETHAYIQAEYGELREVELATGKSELISTGSPYWQYNTNGYNNLVTSSWNNPWLHIDSNLNLYAIDYQSLSNGHNQGMGAKFSRQSSGWVEESAFNQTVFPAMPYGISNEIPGSLLINTQWIVSNQTTGAVYEIELIGSTLNVYSYDFDQVARQNLIYTKALSVPMSFSTFLGRNYIEESIITDGVSVIRLSAQGNSVVADQIVVPSSLPLRTTIRGQQFMNGITVGPVTNWAYKYGVIFARNPANQRIYTWDLDPTHSAKLAPIDFSNWISFPYQSE